MPEQRKTFHQGLDEIREGRLLAQFGKAVGDSAGSAARRRDESNLGGGEFTRLDGILEERIERIGLTGTGTTGKNHERSLGEAL